MKNHFQFIYFTALSLFMSNFLCNTCFSAAFVTKSEAELYSNTSKSSVLKKIPEGTTVEGKERIGMFWKVSISGVEGYISLMKLKPKGGSGDSNLSKALQDAVQTERQESDSSSMRSRSTVMGVRGLDDTSDTSYAGTVRPNLRAVYNMENFVTPVDQINDLENLVQKEMEERSAKNP